MLVKVDRDKRARAEAVTPLFEAGRVFFPADAVWRSGLEDELATFPVAAHDDQVDSVTMALNCLRESAYASGPAPILSSESMFSITGLRRWLNGGPPLLPVAEPGTVRARAYAKVVNGQPLTGEEENALIFGE